MVDSADSELPPSLRDRSEMTRGERLALIKAEIRAGGGKGKVLPKAPQVDIGECPDVTSPDFHAKLHQAFARRMWALAAGADTTPQDVVGGYAATRIAARIGADKQPTKRARLRMKSILPSSNAPGDEE